MTQLQKRLRRSSIIEPLHGRVGFLASGGGSIAAGTLRKAFVDRTGGSAEGGLTLVKGDASFSGGQVPSDQGFELYGLSARIHMLDHAAVVTEAQKEIIAEATALRFHYAGAEFDLGKLAEYLGPFGAPLGSNNVTNIRRFGWPWLDEDEPFICRPGKAFWLEAETMRACSVTADKTYVVSFVLPRRVIQEGDAAVRQ